jgi:glycerol-3-phosphate cytidylyltransferase
MSRVYVGATFDLFHKGHVELLRRAAQYGDVYVALNRDEFVERYKGKRPVMNIEERMAVVEACRYVKGVLINTGDEDSKPSIEVVRPDFIVVGSDWLEKDIMKQLGVSESYLKERGQHILFFPYTSGVSSTEIKKRLGG